MVLLLANGLYAVWGSGWLLPWGWGPKQQTEPERMVQQIKPETVRLLPNKELAAQQNLATEEANATHCWMAGPFSGDELAALRGALSVALPAKLWKLDVRNEPVRWAVYMGKYDSDEQQNRKQAELKKMDISASVASDADWQPGLYLGVYVSEGDATKALQKLTAKGVRSAKVVQLSEGGESARLVLSAVTNEQKAKVDAQAQVLAGKALERCP